jgi:integrase
VFDADEFMNSMIAAGYSAKSCAVYCPTLARADVAGLDLDSVGPRELREYAESTPRTRASRALLRSSLSCYWALTGRLDGPLGAIPIPRRPKGRCRALDERTAASLACRAFARNDEKGLAVLLGLYAGLRRAEIAALRWTDVDDEGWLTVVGKGDRTRVIPLHPILVAALASRRCHLPSAGGSDFVFPGRFGAGQHPATVWGWVREVALDAGLGKISTHVLRHTALATALDATRDLRAVQELAGHASPETTAIYTRATKARLEAAVAAIDYS